MSQMNDADRRENARFLVEDNAIAVLGPIAEGLGHVIELSLSGFSFLCDEEERVPNQQDKNLTFFGFETLNLGKVHLKTVSDRKIASHGGARNSRRCGVKFEDLTDIQKEQLKSFIYHNAYIELDH